MPLLGDELQRRRSRRAGQGMAVSVAVRQPVAPGVNLHHGLRMAVLLRHRDLLPRRVQGHAHPVPVVQGVAQDHIAENIFAVCSHGTRLLPSAV